MERARRAAREAQSGVPGRARASCMKATPYPEARRAATKARGGVKARKRLRAFCGRAASSRAGVQHPSSCAGRPRTSRYAVFYLIYMEITVFLLCIHGGDTIYTFTAVIEKCPDTNLYIGYIPGFPGAHSQGGTIEELNRNLKEVVEMMLEDYDLSLQTIIY